MISIPHPTATLEWRNEHQLVQRLRKRIARFSPPDGDFAAYAEFLRDSAGIFSPDFRAMLETEIAAEAAAAALGLRRPVPGWQRLLSRPPRMQYSLAEWTLRVTRGLWIDDVAWVEAEIVARYRQSWAAAQAEGQPETEAHRTAMAALGSPAAARAEFLQRAYTDLEKRTEHSAETLHDRYRAMRWAYLLCFLALLGGLSFFGYMLRLSAGIEDFDLDPQLRGIFAVMCFGAIYLALLTAAGFFWRPARAEATPIRIVLSGYTALFMPYQSLALCMLFLANADAPLEIQRVALGAGTCAGLVLIVSVIVDMSLLRRLRSKQCATASSPHPAED